MLQVHMWVRVLVASILLGAVLVVTPMLLPDSVRSRLPAGWANLSVNLGLDLQGGSTLLLEVQFDEVQKDKVESMLIDLRHGLHKAGIAFGKAAITTDSVSVQLLSHGDVERAREIVDSLNPSAGGGVLGGVARQYDVTVSSDDRITMRMTDAYKKQALNEIVSQSMEVVRKRIDEIGTREPAIERQGDDRIVVQVPGLQDPSRLKKMLQTTAKMSFQLVDETADI